MVNSMPRFFMPYFYCHIFNATFSCLRSALLVAVVSGRRRRDVVVPAVVVEPSLDQVPIWLI
jgi:hypothetical protein